MNKARFHTRLAASAILFLLAPLARAQYSEYDVKAAFLYNFAQFVKWPSAPSGPVTIGVLGQNPFGGALESAGRGQINVRYSQRLDDLKNCQILFICKSERGRIGEILGGLEGASVLTVSDADQFAHKGGMIGFTMDNGKVHFEINPGAGKRAGLEISSKLMRLGKIVGSG